MIRIAATVAGIVSLALALAACSPLRTLNAVSGGGGGYAVTGDVAYGALDRQRLDIYRPTASAPAAGWPLVVFFYGGSWSSGRRADYAFVGQALASRGIVAVVADYRLYPEVTYPDFMTDSALALGHGLDQARRLGADPKRVFVMGHSAGGYNAAMLALDARWLATVGHSPGELAGWIGLSGPTTSCRAKTRRCRRSFTIRLTHPACSRSITCTLAHPGPFSARRPTTRSSASSAARSVSRMTCRRPACR